MKLLDKTLILAVVVVWIAVVVKCKYFLVLLWPSNKCFFSD